MQINRENILKEQGFFRKYQGIPNCSVSISRERPFLTHVWLGRGRELFSPANLQVRRMEMSNEIGSRVRYGEAFSRAHHKAWQQSALNQREYCEAYGIPLKAFGNWRAKFKTEPQPSVRQLLYRRRG